MNRIVRFCRQLLVLAFVLLVPSASFAIEKPSLCIVGVGASKYQHREYEKGVAFSAKDARNVVEVFRAQQGKRYSRVEMKILLDTCHAGGFGFAGADFAALASCGSKEQSSEIPAIQNGFFTRCLLDGLSGGADHNADGSVSFAELESHLHRHLPTITDGKQHLTAHRPAAFAADLPLASVVFQAPFTKTGPARVK